MIRRMVVVAGKCLGKSRRETIWGDVVGVNLLAFRWVLFFISRPTIFVTHMYIMCVAVPLVIGMLLTVYRRSLSLAHAHICQRRGRGRFISSFEYPVSLFYSMQGQ